MLGWGSPLLEKLRTPRPADESEWLDFHWRQAPFEARAGLEAAGAVSRFVPSLQVL